MAQWRLLGPPHGGISGSAVHIDPTVHAYRLDVPGHIVELLAQISTCILRSVSWPVSIATRDSPVVQSGHRSDERQRRSPRGRHGLGALGSADGTADDVLFKPTDPGLAGIFGMSCGDFVHCPGTATGTIRSR